MSHTESQAAAPANLSTRRVHRRVWTIAFPAILANSSAPLVGLVDTWAVGHLPGAVHLAAVGLGSVIFNFLFWAFGFLRMGTTGLVAQAHGRGDSQELGRVVARSCALALAFGALLWVLQEPIWRLGLAALAPPADVVTVTEAYYDLRIWAAPASLLVFAISGVLFGLGKTTAVLVLQVALNLGNAVLNVWFVVGLELGVPGVALGTLIAQWLAALLGLWLLWRIPAVSRGLGVLRDRATWILSSFRPLLVLNGFIFLRTILLMIALTLIMREAAGLGETAMAASHVLNQYLLLISLGLDGFAHAAEAQAGAAWGHGRKTEFRRWVRVSGAWAFVASLAYAALFWWAGDGITAMLTDIEAVRRATAAVMPLVAALPVVAVACYHFDGVFIGATAARAMLGTMAVAFVVYVLILGPMTTRWGLAGLWGAVLVFMAVRGLTQALWYPRLLRRLAD
ncbi:MAG: MATE family efflux transporter [Xanthomonadales bacterium]|nr:MATE family efflux transporter [Xanthomonadales bacterium]